MIHAIQCVFVFAALLGCGALQAVEKPPSPWTIQKAAGLPDWLKFTVQNRTRYEGLSNSFRRSTNGGDQVFAFRTQVFAEASFEQFRIGAESIDSWIENPTSNTPVNTTLVNEKAEFSRVEDLYWPLKQDRLPPGRLRVHSYSGTESRR